MMKGMKYIAIRIIAFIQSVGIMLLFGLDDANIMLNALKRNKQKKLTELKARRRYLKHCVKEGKDHASRHNAH